MECPGRALMERRAGGDQESLSELMRRHHQRLFRVAIGYVRDAHDAPEIVQETFVKAYRNAARWRRAVEEPLQAEAVHDGRWTADGPSPERRMLGQELRERLDAALLALPERQRAIFVLRHYQGLELSEIAGALDMRLGTGKSGLHRALAR